MTNQKQGRRRRCTFRLEPLESRELLSSGLWPDRLTADVVPLAKGSHKVIKGSLAGEGFISPITTSTGTVSLSASGTATIIGQANFAGSDTYSVSRKHTVKYTNGGGSISDTAGDTIGVRFSGSGEEATGGNFTFKVNGPVTGGSGSFTGAKGKFSATGTFAEGTGALSIKFTVTLTQT